MVAISAEHCCPRYLLHSRAAAYAIPGCHCAPIHLNHFATSFKSIVRIVLKQRPSSIVAFHELDSRVSSASGFQPRYFDSTQSRCDQLLQIENQIRDTAVVAGESDVNRTPAMRTTVSIQTSCYLLTTQFCVLVVLFGCVKAACSAMIFNATAGRQSRYQSNIPPT